MPDDLIIGIGADPSGLNTGLGKAEEMIDRFVSRVQRIGDIGQELTSLGTKLTASITLPILGLGGAAIKAFGDIEALKKGLEAVTGSADAANAEFNKLKEVAKLPGLGLEEAVKGSINLQAIGLDADRSRKILLQFGNAVATVGKGRAEFERAIYGVQQLANTDFPLGEDLNIIKDALPQVSNLLKEAFGTSRSEELTKLGITSKQVIDVILGGLEKLPRVSGGIKGAFENLSDSIKTNFARVGDIINKNINISALIDKITSAIDTIVTKFENLDPTIQKIILVVAGLVAALGPVLLVIGAIASAVPTLITGIGALSAAFTFLLGPVGLVTIALVGVVAAVVSNWDKIRPYLESTIDRFKRLYNESAIFRTGINTIGFSFEVLARVSYIALKTIYENFKDVAKGILKIFDGLGDVIEGVLTFDFSLSKTGALKTLVAIGGATKDLLVNNARGLNEIGKAIDATEKKYSDFRFDLSKKTDLSINIPVKLGDEKDGLKSGLKKTIDKVKAEIEALTAVDIKPRGFLDAFGDEFKSVNDLLASESARTQMILGTQLPTIIDEAGLKLIESNYKYQQAIATLNENLSSLISESTIVGIQDLFTAVGESLANGGSALQAIGQSILQTLGSFISKFGAELVKTALLSEVFGGLIIAIKNAFGNPYVLLALGAAAIAIGAAVSASARKTSATAGGSPSTATGSNVGNNYSGNYTSGGGGGPQEIILRASGPDLVAVINRNVIEQDRLNAG